jgi:hypothetical protein
MQIDRGTNRQAYLDKQGKLEADERVLLFGHCECDHYEHAGHPGKPCTNEPGPGNIYCGSKTGDVLRICDKCRMELLLAHIKTL